MKINKSVNNQEISNNEQLVRELLKPGTLIWGGRFITKTSWHNLCTQGILPAVVHNSNNFAIRPYSVCFAMLSCLQMEHKVMANYIHAAHEGPKQSSEIYNYLPEIDELGIIVDTNLLINDFKNRLLAVGDRFHNNPSQFPYDIDKKEVNEIPIGYVSSYSEDPWFDEVILNFDNIDFDKKGVIPKYWKGLVVSINNFDLIKEWIVEEEMENLPIITPEGELL